MRLRVTDVERTVVRIPLRDRNRPWTELLAGQFAVAEICRVTTNVPGVVGYGETLPHYTWRTVSDESARRVVGRNPIELLADDTLGAGLQMALYDAVGKALEVPMYHLLNAPIVRDQIPISWWSTKMPASVLAEEAKAAVAEGYLSHKFKARPWFDVREQVRAIADVTPTTYKVDIDWNEMLLSPGEATNLLRELDQEPRVGIYEDPIFRMDVAGQRFLRERVAHPLATHFEAHMFPSWIREDALDGFVIDAGGVSKFLRDGQLCAAFDKNFWLQILGSGITTAYTLHLGAVLTHSRWPAVTALNLFADDLLVEPLAIAGGFASVPDGFGLGVEVDESALDAHQMPEPYTLEFPRKLLTFSLPDGRAREFAGIDHLWRCSWGDGTFPTQSPGANLEIWEDDETEAFNDRYLAATRKPGGLGDSIL